MKKATLTLGLFSMMLVLTSFTTPSQTITLLKNENNTRQTGMILPSYSVKSDSSIELVFTTQSSQVYDFSQNIELSDSHNEPGGGTPSYPRKID